jgi:Tfp pilus assembly protein PilZ
MDRRSRKRQTIRVPVAIHSKDGGLQADGYTRDFSNGGIFLYTKSKIATGSNLEIVLILPAEFTHSEKRWVCCQASWFASSRRPKAVISAWQLESMTCRSYRNHRVKL